MEKENPTNPNKSSKSFFENAYDLAKEILDIREGTNKSGTAETIKNNISFKGIQSWILIFSVFIASIGLYTSSTAVVIGAMLISPLMGPIVGIGYSVSVNDSETLKRSLQNFFIMVIISVLTAYLFFLISPQLEFTAELKSRTSPTVFDVLIAICGGFGGVIALTRNESSNVIPGVAIATALMPPLCTAGYGLSIGSEIMGNYTGWQIFLNAGYLFFINSFFIALTTFTVLKVLRFPMVKYQDMKTRKKNSLIISSFAVLIIVPSIFIFMRTLKEVQFKSNSIKFINTIKKSGYNVAREETTFNESQKSIKLFFLKPVPIEIKEQWQILMTDNGLGDAKLMINDGQDFSKILATERETSTQFLFNRLEQKDSIIEHLKSEVNNLQSDSIPFASVSRELQVQYPNVSYFGYGLIQGTNFKSKKHAPAFIINWKNDSLALQKKEAEKIKKWLKVRLNVEDIQILNRVN